MSAIPAPSPPSKAAMVLHEVLCDQYDPITIYDVAPDKDPDSRGWVNCLHLMWELRTAGLAIAVGVDDERRELWVAMDPPTTNHGGNGRQQE